MRTGPKDIPMLLSSDMVRAFLEGRKTQTRRLSNKHNAQPGDRIWFKETFHTSKGGITVFRGWTAGLTFSFKWKPSIFMPKSVCRCWAEITEVREERLQHISEKDCLMEGVKCPDLRLSYAVLWDSLNKKPGTRWINNPTVFVFSFRKIKP